MPCAHGGQCVEFYPILRSKNTKGQSALTFVRPLCRSAAVQRQGSPTALPFSCGVPSLDFLHANLEDGGSHLLPVASLLERIGRAVDRGFVEILAHQHHADW